MTHYGQSFRNSSCAGRSGSAMRGAEIGECGHASHAMRSAVHATRCDRFRAFPRCRLPARAIPASTIRIAHSRDHGDHDTGADVRVADRSVVRRERPADDEITGLHPVVSASLRAQRRWPRACLGVSLLSLPGGPRRRLGRAKGGRKR
jgi:hypothetical protein